MIIFAGDKQLIDTMKHKYLIKTICVLLTLMMGMGLTSCGSDEPDMLVGYYMEIQSSIAFMASSEDEEQGTMSDHEESNVLYTTIMRMKRALRETYPVTNYEGDDAAVISALDSIYRKYKSMYGAMERNTVCVVKLYRTSMDGIVVKHSRALKTYHFGALPPTTDDGNS